MWPTHSSLKWVVVSKAIRTFCKISLFGPNTNPRSLALSLASPLLLLAEGDRDKTQLGCVWSLALTSSEEIATSASDQQSRCPPLQKAPCQVLQKALLPPARRFTLQPVIGRGELVNHCG